MEAHYDSNKAGDLYLFGWVNDKEQKVVGIAIPKMLSLLLHGDMNKPVIGLNSFKTNERPPVNFVFQTYHLMVMIGFALIGLSSLGLFLLWRKNLFDNEFVLKIMVLSVLAPQIANQMGWFTAEVGRQPWIVYGILRTSEGLSKSVSSNHILFSLVLFSFVYLLLFALFIFLLNEKIKHGPDNELDEDTMYKSQKQIFEVKI
jgi:cytochrome d ubiquinol oxidase subunit I